MTVALALVAALAYGVGDFLGGSGARRAPALAILLVSQPVGVIPVLAVALALPASQVGSGWAWGAAAGVGGGFGVLLFYQGLATSPMSVVAPLTAVSSAVVPVLVGMALGERPGALAYVGMVLAGAAVALVSRGEQHGMSDTVRRSITRRGVALALLAGAGFGFYFVMFARAPRASGLWPVVAERLMAWAIFGVLALAGAAGGRVLPRDRALLLAVLAGVVDSVANIAYLVAVRGGLLSVVAVIASLYPATTVLLARIVFHERLALPQRVGLGAAALAVGLLALRAA